MTILPGVPVVNFLLGMHVVTFARGAKKDNAQGEYIIYILSRVTPEALNSGERKPI